MLIDLTSLISGKVSKINFEYALDINDEENHIIPPDDVFFTAPVKVSGSVCDNAGYMALCAAAEIEYATHCARCLEDVSGKFVLEFNRTVATAGTLQDESNDEYVIVKNGFLNIDCAIVEDLLLEFPAVLLCKEDCAGLCLKCGKNLNFGMCGCDKEKEIDPRLAILKKLLEKE